MSDLTDQFGIRTQRFQYEHYNACLQDRTNTIQTNRRDIHLPDPRLVDAESELRGITRYYSRLPRSRYQGTCSSKNDKNTPVCTNIPAIDQKCRRKIVTNYYYNGPTKNYDTDVTFLKRRRTQ